ncbi:MAG TPA: hypothetical protein VLL76_09530 [Candidatus Omnitrophota bacterium]|nr:hypothetical protein [Candidatus Omnitrophota bacterium]
MIVLGLLCAAALFLFRAIHRRGEAQLLASIGFYAGVVLFILKTSPELLVPAIVLAILLASVGLVRQLASMSAAPVKAEARQAFFSDR